ncbi:zinc carboxypeptidase family protein (macronuclear) [Tetrahymena thermophila SB210]|uniref:Zinc carboxypeptidase family protein n=1 Tax=Tetrahymena thermophila (strain SB210) TaxID=312017 RepID=Q22LL2_TETTS|nr:zinc carboxypeptidase family protein [Tetrahymena thermophila SB210]EAR86128.2 zinc carboxypeptidase family protein [Tetrahymena thermophila SB210]|eukprot:XP_976723.2 zinc carboxypeptidase family protein [Tetrahymena thermophila SB210]
MDQITVQNLKCEKHRNKHLQFIQVNDLLNESQTDKPLFQCSSCFNHDLQFKAINYLMIDQIIQEAENTIIPKWPPVNDYQVITNLINLTSNQSQLNYVKQITDFFNQFKEEFVAKIDIIQKKMINETLKYPIDNQQIIQKYQEISSILEFKQLLSNQQTNNLQQHSTLCREFIKQKESQKDQNTDLLKNLFIQANQVQSNFNLEYPKIIKQQLFTLIDNISFFNQDIEKIRQNKSYSNIQLDNINNLNNHDSFKLSSDFLVKLISNKSNFCSEQFLNELNSTLQTLNPFLQQLKFDSIFKENKQPIDFSKISDQNLGKIEDYVKHQINLASDQQYVNQIKNSLEIKQINLVMNSKVNFLKREFTQQFENFLIDIKPFLKQINFTEIFSDQNKFDLFRNLQDETVNQLSQNNLLIQQNFELISTNYKNGQLNCLVKKKENGEYEIEKLNEDNWINCISNINLEKNLKYIFRIQVGSINEENNIIIGLMRFQNSNLNDGYQEYLCCPLKNRNNFFIKFCEFGIDKRLKGDEFKIKKENIIEMRVHLREQILEVLDYPNYQYKLGLQDQYKSKLTQYDDLRLYLGIFYKGSKIILKDAKIVNQFIE